MLSPSRHRSNSSSCLPSQPLGPHPLNKPPSPLGLPKQHHIPHPSTCMEAHHLPRVLPSSSSRLASLGLYLPLHSLHPPRPPPPPPTLASLEVPLSPPIRTRASPCPNNSTPPSTRPRSSPGTCLLRPLPVASHHKGAPQACRVHRSNIHPCLGPPCPRPTMWPRGPPSPACLRLWGLPQGVCLGHQFSQGCRGTLPSRTVSVPTIVPSPCSKPASTICLHNILNIIQQTIKWCGLYCGRGQAVQCH